jgi:hypothetical protein
MTWFDSGWSRRKPITVKAALSASALSDFPLHVDLNRTTHTGDAARTDLRDVAFTDSDGTTQLAHQLEVRPQLFEGGWGWFQRPRTVYYEGTSKCYYGGGYLNTSPTGTIFAWSLDCATSVLTQFSLNATLASNEEAAPSILVLASGKIVCFYNTGDSTGIRYRISSAAEAVGAFATEVAISGTGTSNFAVPYRFGSDIFVFYRSGNYTWSYVKTTETNIATNTWDAPVAVWSDNYGVPIATSQVSCLNGTSRIDFCQSMGAPHTVSANHLYHFYATYSGGSLAFKASDGTAITLPATHSNTTLVYDATTVNGWQWDIKAGGDGYPRVLYSTFNSSSDYRYYIRKWNGSAWATAALVVAANGGTLVTSYNYAPGICFDGNDIDVVYAGVYNAGGFAEMQRYASSDAGATWSKTDDITSGTGTNPSASHEHNVHPQSPQGYAGPQVVFFIGGKWAAANDYTATISCWPALVTGATVCVPSFAGGADQTIYAYYGNATADDQQDAANTWDANFVRVYRMRDKPGDALTIVDEVGNKDATRHYGYNLPKHGLTGGILSSGSGVDNVDIGTSAEWNPVGWTALTIEAFCASTSGTGYIVSNWAANGACVLFRDNADVLQSYVRLVGDVQKGAPDIALSRNTDHYVALAFDGTDVRSQVDGTETSGTATGAALAAANSAVALTMATPWVGPAYEVRISNVRRSLAWRNATRLAKTAQATVVAWGDEEINVVVEEVSETASAADTFAVMRAVRAVADVSAGGWTPATGSTLYGDLGATETPTYIQSGADPTDDACVVKLLATSLPDLVDVGLLNLSIELGSAGGTSSCVVKLHQGNPAGTHTEVAAWTHADMADDSSELFNHQLTADEIAAITDAADLYVELIAS